MKYRILIVLLLLIVPIYTNAKDISVSSNTEKFSNFNFHLKVGKKIQGSIIVRNDGEKDLNVEMFFEQKNISKNSFSDMIFIVGEIPKKYKNELEKKENNIIELCESYDSDKDLADWCNGTKRPKIKVESKKEKKIEYLLSFSDDIKEKTENILQVYSKNIKYNKEGVEEVSEEDYVEKSSVKMVFDPIIDRNVNLKIETLSLVRSLDTFDFIGWAKNGFKETYDAKITIVNNSKNQKELEIPFVVDLVSEPLKFTDKSVISKNGNIKADVSIEKDFEKIKVPRFGVVLIGVDIKYRNNGEDKIFSTEQVRIFIFPLKELISVFSIITLIWFLRIFWRKGKKFIRNGKKKHVKIDEVRSLDESLLENHEKNKINDNLSDDIKNSNFLKTFSTTLSSDNIDIEWMKKEDGYDESLKKQEKKLNRSIILIAFVLIVIIVIFAFISLRGESKKINLESHEDVSIEDLITKDVEVKKETFQELIDNEMEEGVNINKKEEIKEDNIIKKIDNGDIRVQVLNGGSPAGTAGKTVDYLDEKGYKVNRADNAENNALGITVHFSGNNKSRAEQVLESVMKFRQGYKGKIKSSKNLIEKYNVDVVVVLGSLNDKVLNKVEVNSSKKEGRRIEILDGGNASENIDKISNILKNESYEINSQKKSNNNYKVTTIYFKSGDEKNANKIHKLIEKSVDRIIKEEFDELVDEYNSDIVIVVSK